MMIPRDTNEYHTNRFCRENFEKETRKAFWGGSFLFCDDDDDDKTRDGENERRSKRRL